MQIKMIFDIRLTNGAKIVLTTDQYEKIESYVTNILLGSSEKKVKQTRQRGGVNFYKRWTDEEREMLVKEFEGFDLKNKGSLKRFGRMMNTKLGRKGTASLNELNRILRRQGSSIEDHTKHITT